MTVQALKLHDLKILHLFIQQMFIYYIPVPVLSAPQILTHLILNSALGVGAIIVFLTL